MIDVTAAILIEAGAIFIARRQDDDLCGWEFPGGKIAPGETPESCLRRELQEPAARNLLTHLSKLAKEGRVTETPAMYSVNGDS